MLRQLMSWPMKGQHRSMIIQKREMYQAIVHSMKYDKNDYKTTI